MGIPCTQTYQIDDPSPTARYDFALQMAEQNRVPLPGSADMFTITAIEFLRYYRGQIYGAPPAGITFENLLFWRAFSIRQDAGRVVADHIETLTLARCTPRKIAKEISMPLGVVNIYLRLFFCVAARLDHANYIIDYVVVPTLCRAGDAATAARRAVAKMVAWRCGPLALRLVTLSGQTATGRPWMSAPEFARLASAAHDLQQLLLAGIDDGGAPNSYGLSRRQEVLEALSALNAGPLGGEPTGQSTLLTWPSQPR